MGSKLIPLAGRYFCPSLLLSVFLLLPFFGGAESALGLFLVHSIVLLLTCVLIWRYKRFQAPRFLIYFLPLLLAFFLSTLFAPYRYGAGLEFWDLCLAGVYAIVAFSTLKEFEPVHRPLVRTAFFLIAVTFIMTILMPHSLHGNRLAGTFANPNDFGTFGLLLALLGLSQYEQESSPSLKRALLILTIVVGICATLAISRSVFIASAIIFLLYLWKRKPGRVLSITVLALLLIGASFLTYRIVYQQDIFQYYRLRIWANTLKATKENLYLGIGPNMLPYYATRFNFPADVEVGRYARIPTTADNQYIQYLIETGFVGCFCFLIGWIALYLTLRSQEQRFLFPRLAYLAVSVIAIFGLPLVNTSILLFFLFLVLVPLSLEPDQHVSIAVKPAIRWLLTSALLALFLFAVLIPYWADHEFKAAVAAKTPEEARYHQSMAARLNPYQPYYVFRFINPIINSRANLDTVTWLKFLPILDHLVELNPIETDFYVGKARVLRILYDKTGQVSYATGVPALYQEALNCAPTNVFLHGEFAGFERHVGHYGLAIAEIQKAIELEPAYVNARYLLAELRFREGNASGAKEAFEEGESLEKHYRNYSLAVGDKYSHRLLEVDASYKQKVKSLILDHAQD